MDGSDGAIVEARRRYAAAPELYFYPDQYNNTFNWRAHFETTGPEILAETAGRVTHFVAALGTSGTFMGTGRYLRANIPDVVLISVQPESPLHGLEGLKHMASAIVPGIYDAALADYAAEVSTEAAHELTRRLAREEGLLVGVSSGANVAAGLLRAADALRTRDRVVMVVVLCDAGDRYLSEHFWDEGRDSRRPRRRRSRGPPRHDAAHAGPGRSCRHRAARPRGLPARVLRRAARRRERRRTRVHPLPNVTTEGPRRRFRVDDKDYLASERKAAAAGLSLLGLLPLTPGSPG